jgi:hypothetical protein
MKKQSLQVRLVLLFTLLFLVCVPHAWAAKSVETSGAKTPPPPLNIIFQPYDLGGSYVYMRDAISTITDKGNGKVGITGETVATQSVDDISVKMFLQKWDGSSWSDIASSLVYSTTNFYYIQAGENMLVQTGYYYRTRSEHKVIEGSSIETYVSYSPSALIN